MSPVSRNDVSVIVPTLDEEGWIERCLDSLRRFSPPWEVIVADGDSRDGTTRIARASAPPSARILSGARRGRGPQMNAGAAVARGEVLLFHHADVVLPDDAPRWIEETLSDPRVIAGAFRTRTIGDAGRSIIAPLLPLADIRSRWSRLPYGDQALFVRASIFRRLGGFADLPLMEDLEISRRLRRAGRIRTVPACVTVSGRRFTSRPVASAVSMSLFPLMYRLGVPAAWLARLYGDPRPASRQDPGR